MASTLRVKTLEIWSSLRRATFPGLGPPPLRPSCLCLLIVVVLAQSMGCSSTRQIIGHGAGTPDSTSWADPEKLDQAIKAEIGESVQIRTKDGGLVSGRLESFDGQVLTVNVTRPNGRQDAQTVKMSDVESISKPEVDAAKTVAVILGAVLIMGALFLISCLIASAGS